jgi:fructose-bisphosphate aldolase class 1
MNIQALTSTARAMIARGKGLLAMDESNGACMAPCAGIPQTVEMRRAWRDAGVLVRALRHPALDIWAGEEECRVPAQRALMHCAWCNCAALRGEYTAAMEKA